MATDKAIEPDSAQTPARQATAEQAFCRHCGEPLTVPESVANGDTQTLEKFVDICSDDCKNTEEDADRLDDLTFNQWACSHLDRLIAAREGGDVSAIPPPDVEGEYERIVAHELFHRANWVHHLPNWIRKPRIGMTGEDDAPHGCPEGRQSWRAWDAFSPMVKRVILFGVLPGIALAIMKSCSLI
jgi:hypothetical protein